MHALIVTTRRPILIASVLLHAFVAADAQDGAQDQADLQDRMVRSTLDGTLQPSRFWAPETAANERRPLLVFLHSWSGDYRQDNATWLKQAQQRRWYFLHPNFRGRNDHPAACGSKLARQDVLDAMADILQAFPVDTGRIYLCGVSGGGHMSMLMAAYHPERFSAVSAWVGISDLAAWHEFHVDAQGRRGRYAEMLEDCCGGPPGTSSEVDAAYRARSPLFHLHRVGALPVDLAAGVNDGHTGSVPVGQTLRAFNRIADGLIAARIDLTAERVSEDEIRQLEQQRQLSGHVQFDVLLGRNVLLRRNAGPSRVTIFDGGHESVREAACVWLAQHHRPTHHRPTHHRPTR